MECRRSYVHVNLCRDGERVDQSLLKKCVDVYVTLGQGSLGVYTALLEHPLFTSTAAFYQRKSQHWLASTSTPEYMTRAEASLVGEAQRVERYLHEVSESALLGVAEKELLTTHASDLLERESSGLRDMLRNDRGVDLARL